MTSYNSNNETFFFNGSQHRRLYGFLHKNSSINKDLGVVYCHPFAEERNMSHSIAVKTADCMSENGIPVLRFDFSGCGDSEDELENVSIENMLLDIGHAVKTLKKKANVSRCIIWGLRTGAGLGLLYSNRFGDIDGLMLWEPVLDFAVYIKRFLRARISSTLVKMQKDGIANETISGNDVIYVGKTLHINGYPISFSLFEEFNQIGKRPFEIIPDFPIAIFSMSLFDKASYMIASYQNACKSNRHASSFHLKVEPFWDRYWRWTCPEASEASFNWILSEFRE